MKKVSFEEKSYNYTKKVFKEMFDMDFDELSDTAKKGLIDVEINHDTSWTRDLYNKNKNKLDRVALFYRGKKITYREMFSSAEKYAAIFASKGVSEGIEVPICMSNCPEFIYTIMGLNLLGAKANIFGIFNEEYLTEIMNECDTDFIISTDDLYEKIKPSIDKSSKSEIIMFSLADSLIDGKNPYMELDKEFYDFENRVEEYGKNGENIISEKDFMTLASKLDIKKIEDYDIGRIDTEFLVTYSSGSTNANRPKAMVHANRSLLTIGRFQDPDLSGLPEMNDLIGEMVIPNHSNTSIISSMSDVLYKGCTVAIEPIYRNDFILRSLVINKPNYISIPRNMVVYAMKQLYSDSFYEGFTMPYMMMLTSVGEPTSKGEEKFINSMLKKARCGSGKFPKPISPVPLSIGGGDCERGGMFFTPYRKYQDLNPKYKLSKGTCELKNYAMVQLAVLDENGNELPRGECGRLVVKTPTTMKYYKNNEEANEKFYIEDAKGRKWSDCFAYGVIEKHGTTKILERVGKELRLNNGSLLPLYKIGELVECDTKNILSYEVVNIDNQIVIHLELQPKRKKSVESILMGIEQRIFNELGFEVSNNVMYRVRSFEEGFVGTKCEKRSYQALVDEGMTEKCVKPIYDKDGKIVLQHLEMEKPKVYQKK